MGAINERFSIPDRLSTSKAWNDDEKGSFKTVYLWLEEPSA
jgi:hypothetical protein